MCLITIATHINTTAGEFLRFRPINDQRSDILQDQRNIKRGHNQHNRLNSNRCQEPKQQNQQLFNNQQIKEKEKEKQAIRVPTLMEVGYAIERRKGKS
jgi:hypothetical protein